jgi:hypothetical protein
MRLEGLRPFLKSLKKKKFFFLEKKKEEEIFTLMEIIHFVV